MVAKIDHYFSRTLLLCPLPSRCSRCGHLIILTTKISKLLVILIVIIPTSNILLLTTNFCWLNHQPEFRSISLSAPHPTRSSPPPIEHTYSTLSHHLSLPSRLRPNSSWSGPSLISRNQHQPTCVAPNTCFTPPSNPSVLLLCSSSSWSTHTQVAAGNAQPVRSTRPQIPASVFYFIH